MVLRDVAFAALPGFSALFLRYLEGDPVIRRFFRHAPTLEALEAGARETGRFPRPDITSILHRQNLAFGSGPASSAAIERLSRPGAVAVVTGQQLGLFSGPLYTIYKALTAVRLSEYLNGRGIPAAPVFWMEGEDHDLAEVMHGAAVRPDGTVETLDFSSALFGTTDLPAIPVRTVRLPEAITGLTANLPEALQGTYGPGLTMVEAFGRMMARIFAPYGLVLFDPGDPEVKPHAAGLLERAVLEAEDLRNAVATRSNELRDSGFHAQATVAPNSTLLFWRRDDERRALQTAGDGFALKGTADICGPMELIGAIRSDPSRFSPNVLLRPLVQDALFPTAAYVAGPAEVAYFAQAEVLYAITGLPMPVVWPRSSFTLIEPEIASILNDTGLTFEDCLAPEAALTTQLLQRTGASRQSDDLRTFAGELEQGLEALRPGLLMAEASLGAALDTARRKMLHNVESLRSRFLQAEAAQSGKAAGWARRLAGHLRPNGNYQERELNIAPFRARWGAALLDRLKNAADPTVFAHRLVHLDQDDAASTEPPGMPPHGATRGRT